MNAVWHLVILLSIGTPQSTFSLANFIKSIKANFELGKIERDCECNEFAHVFISRRCFCARWTQILKSKIHRHSQAAAASKHRREDTYVQWVNELYSLIHCVGRAKCNIRRFGKHRPSTSTMRTRVSMQLLLLSANDDQTASISRKQKTKRHFYDLTYIDAIKHTLRSHVILSIFLLLPFFVFFANKTDCIILVVSKMFASYSFYFQFGQSTGTCFVWSEAARYCMCNALKRMLAHKIELFFFYTYVNR